MLHQRAIYWEYCTTIYILRTTWCSRRSMHCKEQDTEFALTNQSRIRSLISQTFCAEQHCQHRQHCHNSWYMAACQCIGWALILMKKEHFANRTSWWHHQVVYTTKDKKALQYKTVNTDC